MSTKADLCSSAREMLNYKIDTLYVMYHHERQTVIIPLVLALLFSLLGAIPTFIVAGWVAGIGTFFIALAVLTLAFPLLLPREMSNSLVTPIQIFYATVCVVWLTIVLATLITFFHLSW